MQFFFSGSQEATNLGPEAVDTAELLLFLDKLFDSLNVNSKVAPSTKPLKGGVTRDSPHEEHWRAAINVLQSMSYFNKDKKKLVKVPSIKNLIHTIKGFIYLKSVLLENFKFKFILTRFFNQDPLENFFSYVRAHGVRNILPGSSHFMSSFKTLLVNNFLTYHSPFSNCEKDNTSMLLGNLKSFLTTNIEIDVDTTLQNLNTDDVQSQFSAIPLHKRTKLNKCTITYYAGYVAKKVSVLVGRKFNCATCKNNLTACSSTANTDFIEAREYKPNLLLRPGSFLVFIVNQAVSHLYYLIPRIANQKYISRFLINVLLKKIDFRPINCPEHNLKIYICNILVRCCLYFWCKKINKIANGKDLKFYTFVKICKQVNLLDPMKIKAMKKWENKRKGKKSFTK